MLTLRGISVSIVEICLAIPPITVEIPVATTTALPLPETILVPLKTIFFCSAVAKLSPSTTSIILYIGSDSPVRDASSIFKL